MTLKFSASEEKLFMTRVKIAKGCDVIHNNMYMEKKENYYFSTPIF